MDVTIRDGLREDLPGVFRLINELAVYEKAPEEVNTNLEELEKDGFGEGSLFKILIAEANKENSSQIESRLHEDRVTGMVLYYFGYSTWKGKMLYVDDIVVQENFRKMKIGSKLFEAIIDIARKAKVKQIRFHVLDWNTPALNFYKKYNTILESYWITCKLIP